MGGIIKEYDYWLDIATPHGGCVVRADSFEELLRLAPSEVVKSMSKIPSLDHETEANFLAKRALNNFYLYKSRHCRRSRMYMVERKGLALEITKLYLAGQRLEQVMAWLKKNKKVKISRSAVGRFFADLKKAGVDQGFNYSQTM